MANLDALPTMRCPDCDGSGETGHCRCTSGDFRCNCLTPCERCNGSCRVLAPEGLLLAILIELENR